MPYMDVLSVRLLLFAPMERWDEGGLFSEKGILWRLVMASRERVRSYIDAFYCWTDIDSW